MSNQKPQKLSIVFESERAWTSLTPETAEVTKSKIIHLLVDLQMLTGIRFSIMEYGLTTQEFGEDQAYMTRVFGTLNT